MVIAGPRWIRLYETNALTTEEAVDIYLPKERLRMGIVAATGGVALVYIASFILSFFGVNISLIHGTGLMGIGFSLIVVGVAAFNLLLDFDMIEKGAKSKAPEYFEWYASFGLMITLVWLYIELLRLLSKLQRR